MAYSGGVPTNVILQTGNQQNLVSWPIVSGSTGYSVQRALDGVTWTTVGTPTTNSYLDTSVTVGTLYYYQVAAVNETGTSAYVATSPINIVPCLPGNINLGYLRYQAQLKCDQLNSNFLTLDEWNININKSMFRLFDELTLKDGENFIVASPYTFSTTGAKNYLLPDGSSNFNVNNVTPPAVYKLLGLDCGVAVGNNAWVTLPRYNWIDRNRFIYPQLQANALGVFNLSYRQMGNSVYFIPNPTAGQYIQVWYVPIMTMLLQDTDMLSFSISGWDEYVIIDAAIKAATKEESWDLVNSLKQDKQVILDQIIAAATNRDQSIPNTISDTRTNTGFFDGGGFGGTGHGMGGWLVALAPGFAANHVGNGLLVHSVLATKCGLANSTLPIFGAYLGYLLLRELCRRIQFPGAGDSIANGISSFSNHIRMILSRGSKKEMIGPYTGRIVATMTRMKRFIRLSIVNPVRSAMCSDRDALPNRFSAKVKTNSAITPPISVASPKPTCRSFFNFWPKPCLKKLFRKHRPGIA